MRVLVFGDSIGYGSWDEEGGWVDRLKRLAHGKTLAREGSTKLQIINLSVGGETSTGILRRLETEIEARYSPNWPFVFIFAYGTNDERIRQGSVETELKIFIENTEKIIAKAKSFTEKIIVLGPPPIQDTQIDFNGSSYSDARIEQYENALRAIANREKIRFTGIRPLYEKAGKENLFCFDRLHPNAQGHEIIKRAIQPKLEEVIGYALT